MGRTLADGYLELRVDSSKLDPETRAAFKKIGFKEKGRQAGRDTGDGFAKGFSERSSTFARVAATTAARLTLVGAAAAAATPGVIHLTAALAPAAGALVALPAAMAAVRVAAGTFKLATAGVGEAIGAGMTGTAKEAKKALDELPPAARTFATAIIGLRPKVEALRQSVAQGFFQPLLADIRPLTDLYFPLLRTQMTALAGPLGGLGAQFAQSARSASVFAGVQALFVNTRLSVINLRAAVDPLAKAFGALISSTAPLLPQIAAGFATAATRVGAFVAAAARSGQIRDIFNAAVVVLKDLGAIALNVGSILRSVFAAATAGGSSLLANLREMTGQVAAFLRSGQGGTALTGVFSALAALGQAMRTTLAAVLPAIAQSVQKLAPAVVALAGPFSQIVVAVAPLLPLAAGLAAQLLMKLTPAIAALAGWLARNQGVLRDFAIGIGVAVVAVKGYELYTKAAAIATGVWTVAQKAAAVAAKVWAAGQWLLNAALTANPIGIVVVAVGALVAAVILAYKHSATFRSIVQGAWQGIQVAVSFAWNNVIKPAVTALVWYFRNVIAPTALFLWHNVIQPAFAGIGYAVKAAWVVIQVALRAFQLYLTNYVFPVVRFFYNNVIKPVFSSIGATVSTIWNKVLRPTFSALGSFLTGTVAPTFRKGVDAIAGAWAKVKEAARAPVAFVVNKVINPLVGGINRVAGFVGVKDRIPAISGFAAGGQIPGTPSTRDNRLAVGPAGMLAVASGEWINRTASTVKNLPLLRRVNSLNRTATMDDLVDVVPDGRARGGLVGDGIGDFFGKLVNGAKGLASAVLHPKDALLKVANAALSRIPGGGALLDVIRGMGRRVIQGVGNFLADKLGAGGLGGASVLGGYRGMERLIAGRFPGLGVISDFRAGARTLTGHQSYHAIGRAVDYPPVRALAAWIKSTFGAKTKELITPWQDLNLLNGRPHTYTGAVWNQHNFAGGNAHVHWAARNGGLIGPRTGIPVFDTGGTLMPGFNTVYNGLGRPEPLVPAGGGDVHFHFHGPVASKQAAKAMVLDAYNDLVQERKIRR